MVDVRFYVNKGKLCMKAEGHANAAPKGEDLVCAAVSTLAITLAETMTLLEEQGCLDCPAQVVLKNGGETVKVRPKPEKTGMVLLAFLYCQNGMVLLKRGYPEFIQVKTFDKAELEAFSIKESSTSRTD